MYQVINVFPYLTLGVVCLLYLTQTKMGGYIGITLSVHLSVCYMSVQLLYRMNGYG